MKNEALKLIKEKRQDKKLAPLFIVLVFILWLPIFWAYATALSK